MGSRGREDAVDGRVWCGLLLLLLLVEAAVDGVPVVEALLLFPGVADGVVCGVAVLWLPPVGAVVEPLLLFPGGVDTVECAVLLSQSATSQLQRVPSVPSIWTSDAGHAQHVSKRLHELF